TLEGSATVQVGNVQQTVPAGQQVEIPLDANQRASGPPTRPHPYNPPDLHNVPLSLLPTQINIVLKKFTANFVPGDKATYYQIDAKTLNGSDLTYTWSNSNGCGKFEPGPTPNVRVWHHGDADGCSHTDTPDGSHSGTITVVVTDNQGVSKTVK